MCKLVLAAVLVLAPIAAWADTVEPCRDNRSNAWNLAEPWEVNTRLFAEGKVRLAVIDTIEPAAAAFHLLVLSPPYDELGGRQCRVISFDGQSGFAGMDLAGLVAGYSPAVGLTFEIPVKVFAPETAESVPALLRVTLDQATGEIKASAPR